MDLALSGKVVVVTGAGRGIGLAVTRGFLADEVADLVVVLASGRLANVTGTDFTIDGGLVSTI
ncbi:MAG: hypothetical protein QOJ48_1004 [Frankiales bacterium]|nr:hypothetical protein [Frankiales bacterium]